MLFKRAICMIGSLNYQCIILDVGMDYISAIFMILSCRTLWRCISRLFHRFDFQNLEMHF